MSSLIGGIFIGLAVTLMLWFNGRVTGISGIFNQALKPPFQQSYWRWSFLLGLITGGLVMFLINPLWFQNISGRSFTQIIIAGFLVGLGTALGSGCTSGHGVCGISRLSPRSIVATISFMLAGLLTVIFIRWMGLSL